MVAVDGVGLGVEVGLGVAVLVGVEVDVGGGVFEGVNDGKPTWGGRAIRRGTRNCSTMPSR